LRDTAAAAPIAIILDDLHAADRPSVDLLHILAREVARTRLLVLGTYREVEARAGEAGVALAKIGREGAVLALDRLPEAVVRAWIAEASPGTPPEVAAEVCALADGNPLFVQEVLRARRIDPRNLPVGLQAILDDTLAPSRAVGLGGRDRTSATAADRARSAVTLAIRRARGDRFHRAGARRAPRERDQDRAVLRLRARPEHHDAVAGDLSRETSHRERTKRLVL
jgi:hypothetical protein